MRVAVIGLGNFGMNVVEELFTQGWDVLALDRNEELVQQAQRFSTRAVTADCTSRETLADLGFARFRNVILSMGENLSGSVLAIMYLKELNVPKVIVKAKNKDHKKVLEKVGADRVILPEREVAIKLVRNLAMPNVLDYLPLKGDYAVVEVEASGAMDGKTLSELDVRKKYNVQVIGMLTAADQSFTLAVSPLTPLEEGQKLVVIGRPQDIENFVSQKG